MTLYEGTKHFSPQDIGDGLIVRSSTPQDAPALLQLVGSVFDAMLGEIPATHSISKTHMTHLVRRILSGTHPTMRPGDFTLVEDTRRVKQRIVGCTGLLHHTWEYENIAFTVGRPEIIATYPEYRHQGLIRATFQLVHSRSLAQGHLVQAITGIPYFYRQLEYDYALDLWDTRIIHATHIPQNTDNLPERYLLRDATTEDVPCIQHLYEKQRRSGMVSLVVDEQWWHYQIATWRSNPQENINSHIQVITDREQSVQGYVITPVPQSKQYMQIWDLEVADSVNLEVALPSLLRGLYDKGVREREGMAGEGVLSELRFMLLPTHSIFPLLDLLHTERRTPAYAWYVRVGDLPRFLAHIAPVLEERLASIQESFTGEIKLDFYRNGLRLVFERGRLSKVEEWQPPHNSRRADAGFPPNVFLQLLFGRRSLAELAYAFPDVWVNDEVEPLLEALFPKRPSWILPVW